MPRPIRRVTLRLGDRARLEQLVRARTTAQRVLDRAQIVLASAAGTAGNAICTHVCVSRPTVSRWLDRYDAEGLAGLTADHARPGRPARISSADEAAIIERTLRTAPPSGTHWGTRLMAQAAGYHHATIARIWQAYGLKPHRVKHFKLSTDPEFVTKLRDVVGLYLHPPERAAVFSFDEKSQIQALDRTQPGLPMKKGRAGTMTHDYKRHGTTTFFAALDVATGKSQQQCLPQHRHEEFLVFLKQMVRSAPKELAVHVILDNYRTHKHANVEAWLAKHPRFHLHFTPTASSWLNLVERWFRELTDKAIRRGVFHSVPDLIEAIEAFLTARNHDPKPFIWTASADAILAKVGRCKTVLETVH